MYQQSIPFGYRMLICELCLLHKINGTDFCVYVAICLIEYSFCFFSFAGQSKNLLLMIQPYHFAILRVFIMQ